MCHEINKLDNCRLVRVLQKLETFTSIGDNSSNTTLIKPSLILKNKTVKNIKCTYSAHKHKK